MDFLSALPGEREDPGSADLRARLAATGSSFLPAHCRLWQRLQFAACLAL